MHDDDDSHDFSGLWKFTHWFPSKDDSQELHEDTMMRAHQHGNTLVLQSVVEDDDHPYLLVHLTLDGQVAMGSWHETAKTNGQFKRTEYSGAGEMLISDDAKSMEGSWVGAGMDHKLGKLKLYTNKWSLERQAA